MQTLFPKAESGRAPDEAPPIPETTESRQEQSREDKPRLEPTRYGDWEKGGRCIDF